MTHDAAGADSRTAALGRLAALAATPPAFAYAALGGNLHNYTSPPALAAISLLAAATFLGAVILWRARPSQPGGSCDHPASRTTPSPQTSGSQGEHGS